MVFTLRKNLNLKNRLSEVPRATRVKDGQNCCVCAHERLFNKRQTVLIMSKFVCETNYPMTSDGNSSHRNEFLL